MSSSGVTVVFVHGDGGPTSRKWRDALDQALGQLDFPQLGRENDVTIVEPRYDDVLVDPPESAYLERTPTGVKDDSSLRYAYELRKDQVFRRLRADLSAGSDGWIPIPDNKLIESLGAGVFDHVPLFISSRNARRRAISRVVAAVPKSGRVVIVGHSLGSVVALAALTRLSPRVKVELFLTIGSPLGMELFSRQLRYEGREKFPYDKVELWANAYGVQDPVTMGRGISSIYPPALDLRLPSGVGHDAHHYLGHLAIAKLIGEVVFGPQVISQDLVLPGARGDVVTAIHPGIAPLLVNFQWLHTWQRWCAQNDRREQATRIATVIELLASDAERRYGELQEQREMPLPPLPNLRREKALQLSTLRFDPRDLLAQLVYLSMERVEAPYRVGDHSKDSRGHCQVQTWTSAFPGAAGRRDADAASAAVNKAIDEARDCFDDDGSWWPWLAGAGLALLAVTGVGLALAVPATLAGAAAITATLAAFGPGGMVGGIATVAALTGAGSALVAGAAALGSTAKQITLAQEAERRAALEQVLALPPEQFRGVLVSLIATARAAQLFKLENPGGMTWSSLTEMEERCAMALALHRIADVDAKGSPRRQWATKLADARTALAWMTKRGMGPQDLERLMLDASGED